MNVLSAESGCGCAKPVLSRTEVEPGGFLSLDVQGTPFPIGDRTVPITVLTDSDETPTIILKLRMLGSRRPPFLLNATSELSFLAVERASLIPSGAVRLLTVRTVEFEGGIGAKDPSFRLTPDNLRIEKVSNVINPYILPGTVIRTSVYKVFFAAAPLESRVSGLVSVVDPWFPEHVTDLKVYVEIRTRVKVAPSRLTLSQVGEQAAGEFVVFTHESEPVPLEAFQFRCDLPLRFEPISANDGVARFRVFAQEPAESSDRLGNVVVRVSSIAGESTTLQVIIAGEKR